MSSALLQEVAGLLDGNLHKTCVRGAYQRMRYTVDMEEPGEGAACGFCSLGAAIRAGIGAGFRLVRKMQCDTLRARVELALPEDGDLDGRQVSAAVRARLAESGADPADFNVRMSNTRLTVVLRRSLASAATLADVFRTASDAAAIARTGAGKPQSRQSNCV